MTVADLRRWLDGQADATEIFVTEYGLRVTPPTLHVATVRKMNGEAFEVLESESVKKKRGEVYVRGLIFSRRPKVVESSPAPAAAPLAPPAGRTADATSKGPGY